MHAVLSTLVHRARALQDQDSLHAHLVFWGGIFRQNGYTNQQIRRVLNAPLRVAQPNKKLESVAFLPYVRPIFNSISTVLSQHNTKSVGPPPRKLSSSLWSVKDNLELKKPGVYSISCECSLVYIGQICHLTDIRLKEYQKHICLDHLVKAAMAEHSINLGGHIQLHHPAILSTEPDT
jgi:hypothetical protein